MASAVSCQADAAFLAVNAPDPAHHTLYLQPFDDIEPGIGPPVDFLCCFVHASFSLTVDVVPASPVSDVTSGVNPHTPENQLVTGDLLGLLARRRPADAFCVVVLTLHDLHPRPGLELRVRAGLGVGVYSFATTWSSAHCPEP